jgi:hypothetical protein
MELPSTSMSSQALSTALLDLSSPSEQDPPVSGSRAYLSPDEHLVRPGTRAEMVRGHLTFAQPASAPHGDRHCELDYVIRAHTRRGYISSTDLLTRAGPASDFATDTCVRKAGTDQKTGTRFLEELAFEVVFTQSSHDITVRADDLSRRGVRRVFAIFVKEGIVKEWSAEARAWKLLTADDVIDDPCLSYPIRVQALLGAAEADNAVARALLAKRNPVLVAAQAATKAESILAVLAARRVAVSDELRARILGCADLCRLDGWLVRAATANAAAEVMAEV